MAVTENAYTGNGSTTNYSFTFPYLKSTDVQVQVDATVTTAWTFANATTVQFNTAPANNAKIKILRKTNVDNLTATFYAGSAIKSEDLNDNFTQNLYSTQETSNRAFETTGGTLTGDLSMGEDANITFEGATDNAHETTLTVADPTADRTITLPNVTGTVVTTGDTGTVTSTMIANGTIVDGDIANATITGNKIVNNTLSANQIAANAITSSELADNAVDRNAIVTDAIDGTKIADDSINSEHYVDGSIDAVHIATNTITATQIADNAITSAELADDAVDTAAITTNAVTTGKITNNAVTTAKIANNAITVDKMADDSVGATELIDASVGTAALTDSAVTSAKIANQTITGGDIAAGTILGLNIQDQNISTPKIGDYAVTTAKLADANVTTIKIQDDAVTTNKIANDAVNGTKIPDNAIQSEHIAANAVTTSEIADAELTTLAGMQSGTASILASGTTLTATLAEINSVVDGKAPQTTISDDDTKYPTSGAVVDYVAAQIAPIGGLEVIANKDSFPETQPAAGVVISIADAGGIVVNGSGTSTTPDTITSDATVTINNINSQFNSTTIDAGVAMMVSSTGSGQIYNYHKATLKEADLLNLSGDINDFAERYRVSADPDNLPNKDEGDLVYDTAANKMKVYDNSTSAWKEVTSTGDFKYLVLTNAGTTNAATYGSATSYDLKENTVSGSAAAVTSAAQLLVSVNGVVQKPNTGTSAPSEGFALADADTIIFSTAPPANSSVYVIQFGSALSITTPGDNTISTTKLQNGAVTEEKLSISNSPVNGYYLQTNGSGTLTWAQHSHYNDDVQVTFGTGTNARIELDTATGSDQFRIDSTNTDMYFRAKDYTFTTGPSGGSAKKAIQIEDEAQVELYYNNAKKAETVSGGFTVTGTCTATAFSGPLTGNVTGTASVASTVTLADESTDTSCYVVYAGGPTGDKALETGSNLTFDSSTGKLYATEFHGDGSNLTGISGGSTSDSQYNVVIGVNAGDNFSGTDAQDNILIGYNAGTDINTGDRNVCIGTDAGKDIEAGHSNHLIGYYAGKSLDSGHSNVFIGKQTAEDTTTGTNNIGIGETLKKNTTGTYNIAIGHGALDHTTVCQRNIGIGNGAGKGTFGQTDSASIYNISIGENAGTGFTTGHTNVYVGVEAGKDNTTANYNIGIGGYALKEVTTGFANTAVGANALSEVETSNYSEAFGYGALRNMTSGGENQAFGSNAGLNISAGTRNIAVGAGALQTNTTGNNNTAVGYRAIYENNGNCNTMVGHSAGYYMDTGGDNTALGYEALRCASGQAAHPDGCVAIGYQALKGLVDGQNNVGMGVYAGSTLTTSSSNVAIGFDALRYGTTADANTCLGKDAGKALTTGSNNVMVGATAGDNAETNANCTYIGMNSDGSANGNSYEQTLGAGLLGKGSNTTYLGGSSGSYNVANSSSFSTTSDRRIKKNIVDNNVGLNLINQIQVKNFEYRNQEEIIQDAPELTDVVESAVVDKEGVQLGVIAQEIKTVLPDVVKTLDTGVLTVDPDNLTWYLINAIKELSAKVTALEGK